jgi:hypothetical protein
MRHIPAGIYLIVFHDNFKCRLFVLPNVVLYYVLKGEMLYCVSSSFLVFCGPLPCGVDLINYEGTPEA